MPNGKKTPVKKTPVKKPTILAKMKKFLVEGNDWDKKFFGVSDMICIQLLPENKSKAKRLALFITFQGKKGRKGLRIADTEQFLELAEIIAHDSTLEIAKNLDKVNPEGQIVSESESEL